MMNKKIIRPKSFKKSHGKDMVDEELKYLHYGTKQQPGNLKRTLKKKGRI